MHRPSLKTLQGCVAAMGIVLIISSSGCGMTTRHRNRQLERSCSQELLGVEDVVFHGHRKTCWRNWNEAEWAAQACPPDHQIEENCELQAVQDVPMVPELP